MERGELFGSTAQRQMRGGGFEDYESYLDSYDWFSEDPTFVESDTGFRVASMVPEPSTIALLLAGAACLLGYAWRRRKRNP